MEPRFDTGVDQPADATPTPETTARQRVPAWVTDPDTWTIAGVLTVLAALAAGALWLSWLLITAIHSAVTTAGHAAGDAVQDLLRWLGDGPIARTITGPVQTYIDSHAAGLPATAAQVRWGWLITGAVLLICASCGSRGARIGWALYGALTAAMVWDASHVDNRDLAVAITAAVWSLLAVPVFTRTRAHRGHHTTVVFPRPTGSADSTESTRPAR